MTLFRQQWKANRANLLGWSVTVALMTWYLAAAFRMLANTGVMKDLTQALETLPPALKALFASGDPIFTMQGWVEGMLYTGIIPLVLLIFTGLYVARSITREMDQHTLEFLLAYLWADVNMFLVLTSIGSLLLSVSLFIDDYPRGVAVMEGLAVALFFAGTALEGGGGFKESLRSLLPFHYFNPPAIISGGGFPWADAAVLAAVSLVFLGLAVYQFGRKQIAA